MKKPNKLNKGDKVALVSLSSGMAGEESIYQRYLVGKKRLEEVFGLEVVEMPNTLKGLEYLYNHPEARAKDMMDVFKDKDIKAIICNIGGDDTIRLLPYIDFDIISDNPKIFKGFSDTIANHFICYKAGLSSFYWTSILAGFSENVEMHDYTKHWIEKVLFDNGVIGEVYPSSYWTSEYLEWTNPDKNLIKRNVYENKGYEIINGSGVDTGRLIGGCIEVM